MINLYTPAEIVSKLDEYVIARNHYLHELEGAASDSFKRNSDLMFSALFILILLQRYKKTLN